LTVPDAKLLLRVTFNRQNYIGTSGSDHFNRKYSESCKWDVHIITKTMLDVLLTGEEAFLFCYFAFSVNIQSIKKSRGTHHLLGDNFQR